MVNEKTFTTSEAATMLKVDPWTVRQYIKAGSLRAHKPGGKWLITESALKSFIARDITFTDCQIAILKLLVATKADRLANARTVERVNLYIPYSMKLTRQALQALQDKGQLQVAIGQRNLHRYYLADYKATLAKLAKLDKLEKLDSQEDQPCQ